jgi:CCR4-NOT transcription complex subunit 6
MMLMNELKQIVQDVNRANSKSANLNSQSDQGANNIPLILCGDLNSLPNSGVVEFLATNRVSTEHAEFKKLGYKDCLRKLSSVDNKNEFTHPFKVACAYSEDVMPFTNYTYDFKGIIDYVFYSKQHLSVLGLLGPLDPVWLKENKVAGCPHPSVPSDHFPLLVEFEMAAPGQTMTGSSAGSTLGSGSNNNSATGGSGGTSAAVSLLNQMSQNGLMNRR